MKGAKGVLINLTCGEDTSLHDIDMAINRVREESDENANIIWGVQKDDDLNGKFKISVISTGIDNENYYKNILQNENNSKFQQVEIEHNFTEKSDSFNGEESNNDKQESFFVDLQETSKKTKITGNQNQENKAIKIHKNALFSLRFLV